VTPGAVNTMPESTLRAFADHGEVHEAAGGGFERVLADAAKAAVQLDRVAGELEQEGIDSFQASYKRLLQQIESRTAAAAA
jgi:transaldolase